MSFRLSLAALLLLAPAVRAQDAKATPDSLVEAFLRAETARINARPLDGAKSLKEWQDRRPRLHREYLDMLGLWPLPEKTPLKAVVTRAVERGDVLVECLHYQSKPNLYVTANLYRPKDAKGRLPAILYVCGHSGKGRDGNKTAFQDHGMWFARNGYVCLVLDTLQLGELPGVHHGTYGRPFLHLKSYGIPGKDVNENRWWWLSAGYTPAGVECWNGVRGIDYLITHPNVDPERIGVTGISGGGAATIWIAAADERVKVAVPVSGMSDLESYVTRKVVNGHCDCMFLNNAYGWEWSTIAALIAPRPMLFANSDNDRIFPMDGNRRIMARLRTAYGLYDKGDLVDEYVSAGGHDYRPDLRVAIFRFLNRHLKGDRGRVEDANDKPLPGRELRVFPEDKDVPAGVLNLRIDETFVPRAKVALPEAKSFPTWKAGLLKELRERCFHALPERVPAADLEGKDGLSRFTRIPGKDSEKTVLLIVLNEEDDLALPEWAKSMLVSSSTALLAPHGSGPARWARKSPPNYVERSHVLLGRTVDSERVRAVAAYARALGEKQKVAVAGSGRAGILAVYAALFEPSIAAVVAVDPPASHKAGPHFLNVLRVLDVPEALGLLAPRPLTLVGASDKGFERTGAIYEAAGAKEQLTRK